MKTNANYQICIKNHLDERWMRHFEGFEVTRHINGEMVISGVMDQAALHGILNRIRDLRLELISLQRYEIENEKRENS